jgi:cytochrome P450
VNELPSVAVDPNLLPDNECPWHRYARAEHTSTAYRFGPAVVVRDMALAKEILGDRSFEQGIRTLMENNPALDPDFVARRKKSLLLREGPDHLRMRRIASKSAFTPKAVDRYRPLIRETMRRLADRVPADGVCDAVATLTHEFPTRVISHVLGGSEDDIEDFSTLVETVLNAQSGDPGAMEQALVAHVDLDAYVMGLIEDRRATPSDDLLTDLIHAETEDGALSTEEVLNTAVSVITAGTDTTRNQLAIGLHVFADHPDRWDAMVDDDSLSMAVDELLRFAPIGHALVRTATSDITVDGLHLPAGTLIVLDIGAAHRDPEIYENADSFDVNRPGPPRHLGFGHGHKYCLGAHLAKAELVEGLRVLRERFVSIEHAGPTVWRQVGFVQGPIELPLRLSAADTP